MESQNEKILLPLLKTHGPVALYNYVRFHVKKQPDRKIVERLLIQWRETEASNSRFDSNANLRCFFALFVGQYLPYMISDMTKPFSYWNEDQKLDCYAITPSLQTFLKTPAVARRSIFYESLKLGDVLVGKVVRSTTLDEYKIHILFFTDGRNYHFGDLNIYLYMKNHKFMDFAVGSYLRVVSSGGDIAGRKLFVTDNPQSLRTAAGDEIVINERLGLIEECDLPLCYQISQKEIRSYDSYFKNPECKISSVEKAMTMFGLKNDRIYSVQPNVESAVSPAPKEVLGYEVEKKILVETYTDNARTSYDTSNVIPALTIVQDALEIDPNNISLLLDRTAIYGTIHDYEKAYSDLCKIADMDISNDKAPQYLRDLVIVMAEWYESKEQYMAAISCYLKLWKVPVFRRDCTIQENIIHLTAKMIALDSDEMKVFTAEAPKVRTYRATFNYKAADDDEISFVKGDIIFNCYAVNDGWLAGTVRRTGETGMLLSSYVTLVI